MSVWKILNRVRRPGWLAFLALGLLALAPGAASADFVLGTGNDAISGYTGPYANVHVALSGGGSTATITFTSLTNGAYTYLMGDGNRVGLNINGAFNAVTSSNG